MEGIRCKVGGGGACEDVSKVKKLTQVCFRQALKFQKKMNMSDQGEREEGTENKKKKKMPQTSQRVWKRLWWSPNWLRW